MNDFLMYSGEISYIELLPRGGWLMVPLSMLSVIAAFIFFDRFFYLRNQRILDDTFFNKLNELVRAGKIEAASALCESANCSESRILRKGIQHIGNSIRDIREYMEMEGKLEVYKYEGSIYFLGVIAGIAPMLGFIGTISGVIKIFYNISLADNISISLISGGLYEKLVTSGVGLAIGIIAYIGYHYLNNRINKMVHAWEFQAVRFLDLINSKTQ